MHKQSVLILDFGSQYTQLIARRVREQKVFSIIHPFSVPFAKIQEINPSAIIFSGGPASLDDGTQNLVGALRTCMGNVGARTVKELQLAEIVIAPAIKTEGKVFQSAQRIGMGK